MSKLGILSGDSVVSDEDGNADLSDTLSSFQSFVFPVYFRTLWVFGAVEWLNDFATFEE